VAKECQKCKDYRDCDGKPWFHYGEIRFCPLQILWVIENSETLRSSWPVSPDGSSYTDLTLKSAYKSEAYFVKPGGILGEVNLRLARTGIHGKLLRAQVLAGYDELSQESKDALMFVKGWRRKHSPFRSWLRQRRYRNKP